jgi:hypothetical protein
MNYFLLLLLVGVCCGGYYEYTVLQQNSIADQQQITDLGTKIDALKADNKKLEDDKDQLTKGAADAQTTIADLTKQIQDAKVALVQAKPQVVAPPNANPPGATATPSTLPGNNLGTITTLDGKTFKNCQLLKVDADGIVVNHSEGIMKILFGLMPPDLQKRFGYDPHQAAALTEAQIEYQEEQRKAAAPVTTGN